MSSGKMLEIACALMRHGGRRHRFGGTYGSPSALRIESPASTRCFWLGTSFERPAQESLGLFPSQVLAAQGLAVLNGQLPEDIAGGQSWNRRLGFRLRRRGHWLGRRSDRGPIRWRYMLCGFGLGAAANADAYGACLPSAGYLGLAGAFFGGGPLLLELRI